MSAGSQNGRVEPGHLNAEWITKYKSKSLGAGELQAAGRHLKECAPCRRALLAGMGPVQLPEELAEMPEALHLSYEQMTGFIDGQLSGKDREVVEAHTFICESCRREIKDLRKLDAQLATPAAEVKPEATRLSLWERMTAAFRVPGAMPRFGVAFGAIIAGVFLLFPRSARFGQQVPCCGPPDQWIAELHTGMHVGGYALLMGGAFYIVYRMWRR